MRRHCVFCRRTGQKITGEHVWPNWIRKLFPDGALNLHHLRHDHPQRQWTVRKKGDSGMQVKDVCKRCNEGWMNGIETSVRPFLGSTIKTGEPRTLSVREQEAFASWAFLRAVVFDLVNDRSLSDQRCHDFYDNDGRPPPRVI